ncbi:MAG: Gfo/Idh/MocA family oxidoreductase [Bacteroidales bacterium]|nr:Gfo/Idh/MocA family oxidoreductase [Bacteroidales bacterium]
MEESRRNFLKKVAVSSAGITLGGLGMSAKSYARIIGANERINMAVIGTNSRGKAHIMALVNSPHTLISHICDVDSRVMSETVKISGELSGYTPVGEKDIRKLLEIRDIDAISIATPDHWHAPMTLMGLQAGKHVYVEKPCSHNPQEGEMLIEAEKKYGKVIQMGTQQRSAPTSQLAIKEIREGIIGDAYMVKTWYANTRGSIGYGKEAPVPEWLDYDLWQGPAPRRAYKDNIIHYNWHWFWNWGTGEINNNATHELDVARWALGVDFPVKINSAGGRFHFKDDWEFYDTQDVSYVYEDGKIITWEGRSCNGFGYFNRGRGSLIYGTKGTIFLDRNAYELFDLGGNLIKRVEEEAESATTDTMGAGNLDIFHMQNFLDAIRKGTKVNSPIAEGHVTNTLCHLGNISQKLGRSLNIDPCNGNVSEDPEAMTFWSREYEKGWEPKV